MGGCLGNREKPTITLEDGTTVSPLQIAPWGIDENAEYTKYVLQELNYRMENCGFEPIKLQTVRIRWPWYKDDSPGMDCRQLAAVYHRLTWCRECLRCLRCGGDIKETLRELLGRLVSQASPGFVKGFRHLTDNMSIAERQRSSEEFQKTVFHASKDLRGSFCSWTDAEQRWHEEDLPLQQAILIHSESHRVLNEKEKKPVPPLTYHSAATRDPRRQNEKRKRVKVVKPEEVTDPAPRRSARVQSRRVPQEGAEEEKQRKKERRVIVAYLTLPDIARAARKTRREMGCRD